METLPANTFEQNYQAHLKHLKLKGLQPKTIDAYARAIRRTGKRFDQRIDELSEPQLTDYFTQLYKWGRHYNALNFLLRTSDRPQELDDSIALGFRHPHEQLACCLCFTAMPQDRFDDVACAPIMQQGAVTVDDFR
jgi:Phage integrase, N-terminal SAM-like domain